MKICMINVTKEQVSKQYTEALNLNLAKCKAENTTIIHKYVKTVSKAVDTVIPYFMLMSANEIVDLTVEAENEGCDAVIIACAGDPALIEAKSIVNIPVVGAMVSSLCMSSLYGGKYGVLTINDVGWIHYCERLINNYGFSRNCVAIESINVPTIELFSNGFSNFSLYKEEIIKNAKILVEQGANSIVIGSAGLSVMLSAIEFYVLEDFNIPIIDCLTTALKFAELQVFLQKKLFVPSVGRNGLYKLLNRENIKNMKEEFFKNNI